jgi:hypothetical protein
MITGFDWKPVPIDGTLGLVLYAEVAVMLEPYITEATRA